MSHPDMTPPHLLDRIGSQCWQQPRPTRDQKIIVFDGPDGCGKTNMGQGLSLDQKVPYFKMTTEAENWRKGTFMEALRFDQTYLAEFLKQTKTDVIIDRAYPSEFVYSRVFNRPTDMQVLRKVDEAFARMGAYIIIPVRHDYSKNRLDDLVPQDKLQEIHDTYMQFRKWSKCSTITIFVDDYGDDLKKEIEVLRPELKWGERLEWAFNVTLGRDQEQKDLGDVFQKGKDL